MQQDAAQFVARLDRENGHGEPSRPRDDNASAARKFRYPTLLRSLGATGRCRLT